jgi:2-oxo-3-hexenedioate decarboxylase
MELRVDGLVVQSGSSDDILGNPLESMVAIARLSLANGECLMPGDIVLAGAATPAVFIDKNQTISAFAEGFPPATLKVI